MSTPNLVPQYLRARLGRVCVAIMGSTTSEMLEKASAAAREHNFLEFRLDYLDKPLAALSHLKEFLSSNGQVTAIATCRRTAGGGNFTGSLASEVEVLTKAIQAGCHLIDLEIESAEGLKKTDLETLRSAGGALVISHHDFNATKDLDDVYQRIAKFSPDFVKIVPTAKSLSDNISLLHFLEKHADQNNVVGISMGDFGVISRVLGVRAGSVFTFASATPGEETGPGQIAARTLVETYRIDQIGTGTKIYGVAGNPIKSSLSPVMLNTAFRRETVNAVYLALQTTKLSDLLRCVQEIPIHGLSVTMPLKQEIIPHLERTDSLSAKIGACNTIVRAQDGKLYGFNTDVGGIVGPLERRRPLRNAKVLVLGAGGAARAAVFGLKDKGADVYILNRTTETAQKLAKQSGAKVFKRDQVAKTHFDILINTTPAGMNGNKLQNILTADELNCGLVFDLVYNPLETPLIRMARQKNIPFITGVEMFVQQGARQFEIWTGKPAPEEEMLRVVLHALRQQAEQQPQPVATTAALEPKVKALAAEQPTAKSKPIKAAAKVTPAKKTTKPPAAKKTSVSSKKSAKSASKKR